MNRLRYRVASLFALVAGVLLFGAGCSSLATRKGFYEPITQSVIAQNFTEAALQLEAARKDNKFAEKDRLLYFIDAGALNHYASNYQTSTERLHEADVAADDLYTKSVLRAAASLILNDNVLEYAGEDYELVYTNIIKALNFLALDDFDGAFVEIRRLNEKLDLLEGKYVEMAREYRLAAAKDSTIPAVDYQAEKVKFYNDAFARYLSMHIYAAEGHYDDARIDYELLHDAFATQPHIYSFEAPPVKYKADSGVLVSFVALVGLAPEKKALSLRLRTDKQLDIVQVLYDSGEKDGQEYGHLPMDVHADYYFKFEIPRLAERPSAVNHIVILANGEKLGELRLIEDVSSIATAIFDVKKPLIYLKTLARAVAKGLSTHEAKEKMDTGGLGGWLKKAAVDVVHDLLENADLRTTQYLPGRIFVGDFEITPGTYDFTIEFYDVNGQLVGRNFVERAEVREAGFNLIEAQALY